MGSVLRGGDVGTFSIACSFSDDSKIWVHICVCFLVLRWGPGNIVTFLKGSVLVPNVLLI